MSKNGNVKPHRVTFENWKTGKFTESMLNFQRDKKHGFSILNIFNNHVEIEAIISEEDYSKIVEFSNKKFDEAVNVLLFEMKKDLENNLCTNPFHKEYLKNEIFRTRRILDNYSSTSGSESILIANNYSLRGLISVEDYNGLYNKELFYYSIAKKKYYDILISSDKVEISNPNLEKNGFTYPDYAKHFILLLLNSKVPKYPNTGREIYRQYIREFNPNLKLITLEGEVKKYHPLLKMSLPVLKPRIKKWKNKNRLCELLSPIDKKSLKYFQSLISDIQ